MDGRRAASIQAAVEFWQARACREVTPEDARQAIANIAGFFETLNRWSIGGSAAPAPERHKEAA